MILDGFPFFYPYDGNTFVHLCWICSSLLIKSYCTQNSPQAPKRDYSTLPLLAAPAQVGERIAFKV